MILFLLLYVRVIKHITFIERFLIMKANKEQNEKKFAELRTQFDANKKMSDAHKGALLGWKKSAKSRFMWFDMTGNHATIDGTLYWECTSDRHEGSFIKGINKRFWGGLQIDGQIHWYKEGVHDRTVDAVDKTKETQTAPKKTTTKKKTAKTTPAPAPVVADVPTPAPKTAKKSKGAYARSGSRPIPKSVQTELEPVVRFMRTYCADSNGEYSQDNVFVSQVMAMIADARTRNAQYAVGMVREFKSQHSIA
jgi:hypothetical protein